MKVAWDRPRPHKFSSSPCSAGPPTKIMSLTTESLWRCKCLPILRKFVQFVDIVNAKYMKALGRDRNEKCLFPLWKWA